MSFTASNERIDGLNIYSTEMTSQLPRRPHLSGGWLVVTVIHYGYTFRAKVGHKLTDTGTCSTRGHRIPDLPNDTAKKGTLASTDSTTDHHGQSSFFDLEETNDVFDGLVAVVITIAQSQCEHATDYAAIKTLVFQLPIDHLTLTSHDASAPYSSLVVEPEKVRTTGRTAS